MQQGVATLPYQFGGVDVYHGGSSGLHGRRITDWPRPGGCDGQDPAIQYQECCKQAGNGWPQKICQYLFHEGPGEVRTGIV